MIPFHHPVMFFHNIESDDCPHGPEPEPDTDTWHNWMDRHRPSDDGLICLDAPAGVMCDACSTGHGEAVPWGLCEERTFTRPVGGMVPNPDAEHQAIPVWIGLRECLDRECDDYYLANGEEKPWVKVCSHIRTSNACSCQRMPGGEYGDTPCTALVAA